MRSLVASLSVALFVGCGPVRSSSYIGEASAAVAAATRAQAQRLAPYEFAAAEAYLDQAEHDRAYAQFQTAIRYGKKSVQCARLARALAERKLKEQSDQEVAPLPQTLICPAGDIEGPTARQLAIQRAEDRR